MRRRGLWFWCLLSIVCMLFTVASISAAQPSYGYAWTLGGVSSLPDSLPDYGFSGISLVVIPFTWTYFEPSLHLEGRFTVQGGSLGIQDVSLGLNFTFFKVLHHPFNFLAPTNPTAYAPAVQVALQHTLHRDTPLRVMAGVSLFRLLEKDAWYEWFSPFVIFNPYACECEAWGITLWRFTYLAY